MAQPTVLYTRMLPGGGVVSIECEPRADAEFFARLKVERRGDPTRREGHAPPIVLECAGIDQQRVMSELYEIAGDNVAIARHLIAWQSKHRRPAS